MKIFLKEFEGIPEFLKVSVPLLFFCCPPHVFCAKMKAENKV